MSANAKLGMALVRAMLSAIIVASVLMTLAIAGPWVETKLWPVVGKLQISDLVPGPRPGTSSFIATFNKLRTCEFLALGWYDNATDERVSLVMMRQVSDDGSVNRPLGVTRTGPWIVSLPPDRIRPSFGWWARPKGWIGSHALLFHRCNPFWITTTEFYP